MCGVSRGVTYVGDVVFEMVVKKMVKCVVSPEE